MFLEDMVWGQPVARTNALSLECQDEFSNTCPFPESYRTMPPPNLGPLFDSSAMKVGLVGGGRVDVCTRVRACVCVCVCVCVCILHIIFFLL